jgi:hypothetical protein
MADKNMLTKAKEAIIGTPEQNAEATTKLKAMKSYEQRKADQDNASSDKYFGLKSGESAKGWKAGGKVSASARADGCCTKGKTRGKMM